MTCSFKGGKTSYINSTMNVELTSSINNIQMDLFVLLQKSILQNVETKVK